MFKKLEKLKPIKIKLKKNLEFYNLTLSIAAYVCVQISDQFNFFNSNILMFLNFALYKILTGSLVIDSFIIIFKFSYFSKSAHKSLVSLNKSGKHYFEIWVRINWFCVSLGFSGPYKSCLKKFILRSFSFNAFVLKLRLGQ